MSPNQIEEDIRQRKNLISQARHQINLIESQTTGDDPEAEKEDDFEIEQLELQVRDWEEEIEALEGELENLT